MTPASRLPVEPGTGYWMSVPHRVEKRRNWEQNYRGQVFLQPTT